MSSSETAPTDTLAAAESLPNGSYQSWFTGTASRRRVGPYHSTRYVNLRAFTLALTTIAGIGLVWSLATPGIDVIAIVLIGIVFTISFVAAIRLFTDPDSGRAHQADDVLRLSRQALDVMKNGMTPEAAQEVCSLLLPSTSAVAVAITDTEQILGYAGYREHAYQPGQPIHTKATLNTVNDGEMRVLVNRKDIGVDETDADVGAAIVVPLMLGRSIFGALKFYYRKPRKITETQCSLAQGFARLLSTQMTAAEMETQRKLATSMELKMLQSQINPHFLFNTINTIASLVRTDPMKARTLLREFAVFYRRTLEDSADRIMLSREIEQTMRYFSFEVARFGEERLALYVGVGPEMEDMLVPPFLIQPIVENAVKHAMPSEGKLTVTVSAEIDGDDVVVVVHDDGVGMSQEDCDSIMNPHKSTGLGIAVKNVHDRMKGFFGPDACMEVESELGVGTSVLLRFPDCAKETAAQRAAQEVERGDALVTSALPEETVEAARPIPVEMLDGIENAAARSEREEEAREEEEREEQRDHLRAHFETILQDVEALEGEEDDESFDELDSARA